MGCSVMWGLSQFTGQSTPWTLTLSNIADAKSGSLESDLGSNLISS